jgi:predicted ester cyclase
MVAEGDTVVCRITVSGTFGQRPSSSGLPVPPGSPGVEGTAFAGPSASGKRYTVKHMHMFKVLRGRIAAHWAARDDLGLLLQLGALTLPA